MYLSELITDHLKCNVRSIFPLFSENRKSIP